MDTPVLGQDKNTQNPAETKSEIAPEANPLVEASIPQSSASIALNFLEMEQSKSSTVPSTIVTHLGQLHKVDGIKEQQFLESIAKSQFSIARYILEKPTAMIFSESLYEDLTPEVYAAINKKDINMAAVAKQIFPEGLAEAFDNLSSLQKEFLSSEGACLTLFYLGAVETVYKSIDREDSDAIDTEISKFKEKYGNAFAFAAVADPELRSLMFDRREAELLEEVTERKIAETNTDRPVIIVFGSAHDFSNEFSNEAGFSFNKQDFAPRRMGSSQSSELRSNPIKSGREAK